MCVNTLCSLRILPSHAKRLEVIIQSPVREASLHKEQMYDGSLDYDGLQPAQHLLKSLSRAGTEFQ